MLDPVGLKLSHAKTDQRKIQLDNSAQSSPALEYGIEYTVVSNNGMELVSKIWKNDWQPKVLTCLTHSYTHREEMVSPN